MAELSTSKEKQILSVAMQVFLERGFHGAKMQEIADRAGVNKAMLHYYFRSKDRLYAMIFEKLFMEFMNSIADSFEAEGDLASTLKHFINSIIDRLRQTPDLPLFVARELSWGGPVVYKTIRRMLQKNRFKTPQIILDEIENAKQRGEIDSSLDPVQFIFTLVGSCIYPFLARPIVESIFPELIENWETLLEQRKEAVFRVLYYGIKGEGTNA